MGGGSGSTTDNEAKGRDRVPNAENLAIAALEIVGVILDAMALLVVSIAL